jgi:hypothetical protein
MVTGSGVTAAQQPQQAPSSSASSSSSSSSAMSSSMTTRKGVVNDPCEIHMEKYLQCVENHPRGLSEGDECGSEAVAYKTCRSKNSSAGKSKLPVK